MHLFLCNAGLCTPKRMGSKKMSHTVQRPTSTTLDDSGSRKRRRLSPAEDVSNVSASSDEDSLDEESDAKSVSEPDNDQNSAVNEDQPVNSVATAPTVSRIKTKTAQTVVESASSVKVPLKEKSNFAALGLDTWLVASLANMAIKHPTGIQHSCIPEIIKGRDCIGGSRTGSGKTVAFAAPILQQWAKDPSGIFAVVLTPTR